MDALHIFRAGRQTPMTGEPIEFTAADLAACAAAYDPALSEAPIVVGHPKTNSPAYGWVKSLAVAGGNLFAEPHQVDPAFAELVTAGRFKKISAAFYLPHSTSNPKPGSYYLRHVGFLGAQPPAVKGLREPQFSEGEEGVVEIEFSEQPELDSREGGNDGNPPNPPEQPMTMTPEQIAALETERDQYKQQLEAERAERQREAAERRCAANAAFAEGLTAKGLLAPKDKPFVEALLDCLGAQPVEFGEGSARQDMAVALKNFLAERGTTVAFGEHATKVRAATNVADADESVAEFAEKGADPERLTLHARARALANEKKIPYQDAVRIAIRTAAK